jgi:hypothetical protein
VAGEELVNVKDPDTGEIGSIPRDQLAAAQQQGFAPATHEEATLFVRNQKYGGVGQQLATGLEGAASAATFGLSTGVEKALGVPEEDILSRREENPISHGAGQVAGLVGSSLLIPGGGAAGLMEQAGARGAAAVGLGAEMAGLEAGNAARVGLEGAQAAKAANAARVAAMAEFGTASRIGSAATKAAIDNMLFQAGDEFSKAIVSDQDPDQILQTAATNIGLFGVVGGALGAAGEGASALWRAKEGGKVGSLLRAISDHAGSNGSSLSPEIAQAIEASGVQVPGELRASLSESQFARQTAKTLEQSDTTSAGKKFQQTLQGFKKDSSDAVLNALGKNADSVNTELSAFDAGKEIQDTLRSELKNKIEPISSSFETVRNEFKNVPLSPEVKGQIAEDVTKMAADRGYTVSPSSIQAKEINRIVNELPGLKTLEDLRKFQSVVGEGMNSPELYGLGKGLKGVFRENEANILEQAFAEKNPALANDLSTGIKRARSDYAEASRIVEDLNDRLRAGRYSSPSSYERVISEMAPEDLLKRIGSKNDVGLLRTLENHFPETAEKVKQAQIDLLIKEAASKAGPDQVINSQKVFSLLDKMSPEYRKFLLPDESLSKIEGVKTLLNKYNEMPHNFSNSARTLDKLNEYVPATAVGMATMIAGHNPALAFLVGALTKAVSKDIPDAVRLGLLKFLGSEKSIEPAAFKATVEFISQAVKGEALINRAAAAAVKGAGEVIPKKLVADDKKIDRLDKRVSELKKDPSPLLKSGDNVGHYMPSHAESIGMLAGNAVAYLSSLKPENHPKAPLDAEIPPSKFQMENYRNALKIAESPLSILENVKDGSIDPDDIEHLARIYPALYQKLSGKLLNEVMEVKSRGEDIPYKTRMGLSLFLGQPLDTTMTPESLQAIQMSQMPPQSQQAPPQGGGHSSLEDMGQIAENSQTPDQARVRDKMNH